MTRWEQWGLLDSEEKARALRLRTDNLRDRFVAAHAILRLILARYTEVAPADLVFSRTSFGKPFLFGQRECFFSLSHSGDRVMVAVSGGAVGVDVEATNLELLPCTEFREWVRREALLKAIGTGFACVPAPGLASRFTARDVPAAPGYVAAVAAEGKQWVTVSREML